MLGPDQEVGTDRADRPRGFSLRRLLGRSRPALGLDIGSTMIKAVSLKRRHGRAVLQQAALTGTPAGVLTEGALTDGIAVARTLKALWQDFRIPGKRVAVGVGGEKVLCQCERLPSTADDDVDVYVRERIADTLPFPIEAALYGFQPAAPAGEGALLWVAAAAERVDWVREAVALAGRQPVAVQAQACALANVYAHAYQPAAGDPALLLNVGARGLTIALTRGWAVVFGREVRFSRAGGTDDGAFEQRVARALEQYWETIVERAKPLGVRNCYLSGGAARAPGVSAALGRTVGLKIEELEPFRRIAFSPSSETGRLVKEHAPALAIAAGLALQSIENS